MENIIFAGLATRIVARDLGGFVAGLREYAQAMESQAFAGLADDLAAQAAQMEDGSDEPPVGAYQGVAGRVVAGVPAYVAAGLEHYAGIAGILGREEEAEELAALAASLRLEAEDLTEAS